MSELVYPRRNSFSPSTAVQPLKAALIQRGDLDNSIIVEQTSMTKFKYIRVLGGWLGSQRR